MGEWFTKCCLDFQVRNPAVQFRVCGRPEVISAAKRTTPFYRSGGTVFRLAEHGTTSRTEVLGGATTIATMAYIIGNGLTPGLTLYPVLEATAGRGVFGRGATTEGSRGFQPTVGNHAKRSRRVATIEPSRCHRQTLSFAPATQSSLRDESMARNRNPWVETHGYRRMSLRDKHRLSNRFPRCLLTTPRPALL